MSDGLDAAWTRTVAPGAGLASIAPDLDRDGGPHGLVLAGGRGQGVAGRPGNDVRHLVRFDLEALPGTVALPGS